MSRKFSTYWSQNFDILLVAYQFDWQLLAQVREFSTNRPSEVRTSRVNLPCWLFRCQHGNQATGNQNISYIYLHEGSFLGLI